MRIDSSFQPDESCIAFTVARAWRTDFTNTAKDDHGNVPEHSDDSESNRRRVRVPRRLRERPDLELRNCRDEEDSPRPVGVGTTYRQIRSIPDTSEEGFDATAFEPTSRLEVHH